MIIWFIIICFYVFKDFFGFEEWYVNWFLKYRDIVKIVSDLDNVLVFNVKLGFIVLEVDVNDFFFGIGFISVLGVFYFLWFLYFFRYVIVCFVYLVRYLKFLYGWILGG